jgi:SnoaL-like protein
MKTLEAKIQYLLDLEEIKQLKYQYCRLNDGGWARQPKSHQGPSADLFTEDGVWDGRPLVIAKGREEIRKLFAGMAALPMAYHAVMNPMIEINGDNAKAHWHLIAGGIALDGTSMISFYGYEDEYVRMPEGWRIKLMRVIWGRTTVPPDGWREVMPNVV